MPRFTVGSLNDLAKAAAAEVTPENIQQGFAPVAASIGDHYSLRNRFLMWVQMPTARRVAGFRAWREQGRKVRKGERGLAILAPVTTKQDKADSGEEGATLNEPSARKLSACHVIYVFDVSQTDPMDPGEHDAEAVTTSHPPAAAPSSDDLAELLTSLTEDGND